MKRLLALLLSLVLMLGVAVPAYATGDGNFDGGGGGMGSGTSTNYWNPGMDGVRISVVNVDSHAVVGNTIDWSNQNPSTNMIHFGKVFSNQNPLDTSRLLGIYRTLCSFQRRQM